MKEWKYLYSEAFKTRYVLASYFVKDYPLVIELGGYKTPISGFLEKTKSIVIDPRTEPLKTEFTTHIKDYFQNVNLDIKEDYAVVILGIELQMSVEQWKKVYSLLNNSKITVIEVPIEHIHSRNQLKMILDNTNLKIDLTIAMDLSNNNFGDMSDSAPPKCKRTIYTLKH